MAKRKKSIWWDKVIDPNMIIKVGDRASLIVLPHDSPFAGYRFWFPNKLIIYGKDVTLRFCLEMEFLLKRRVGEDKTITGAEFQEI